MQEKESNTNKRVEIVQKKNVHSLTPLSIVKVAKLSHQLTKLHSKTQIHGQHFVKVARLSNQLMKLIHIQIQIPRKFFTFVS